MSIVYATKNCFSFEEETLNPDPGPTLESNPEPDPDPDPEPDPEPDPDPDPTLTPTPSLTLTLILTLTLSLTLTMYATNSCFSIEQTQISECTRHINDTPKFTNLTHTALTMTLA